MQVKVAVLLICLTNASCLHHSLFNTDRQALKKADTVRHLQPIPHNSLEWWYFNGHLIDSFGGEYAFHTALFRRHSFPFPPVWMSNTALADLSRDTVIRHYHFYKKRAFSFSKKDSVNIQGPPLGFDLRNRRWNLRASESSFGWQFKGYSATPPVPMALDGIMHYGSQRAGYLSMPWLSWVGELRIGDSSKSVTGSGWFDRQWSALKITRPRYAWNWISLEHDSFRLMVFGMHDIRKDTVFLQATQVKPGGEVQFYSVEPWMLRGTEPLANKADNKQYPQIWQLWIPEIDLKVCMKSKVEDAIITLRVFRRPFMTYWEGPAQAWGIYRGNPFQSNAFIELTRP